jgi:hypothetical protein
MFRMLAVALLVSLSVAVSAQDPLQTDPDKYRLLLQNDRVRVLEYRDKPGDKTNRHTHKDFVLHALSSFERRLVFGDGRIMERSFSVGETLWMDSQSHIGENIGTTETHVLLVELIEPRPAVAPNR